MILDLVCFYKKNKSKKVKNKNQEEISNKNQKPARMVFRLGRHRSQTSPPKSFVWALSGYSRDGGPNTNHRRRLQKNIGN